jgi:urea carboxylase-associated protein 1
MKVLEDVTVQPGQPWGRRIAKGERLKIVDLEGKQAVDFLCFDAADPADRYNAANTIKLNAKLFVEKGSILVSEQANTLLRVVEDSCGRHDTIGGCCSAQMNLLRYGKPGPANCRDTFITALKPFGLGARDVVANVNFFMYVPVLADGHTAITEGGSKPGDYVELVAERDVIAVISNCAQIYNPCNGFKPTPVRVTVSKE